MLSLFPIEANSERKRLKHQISGCIKWALGDAYIYSDVGTTISYPCRTCLPILARFPKKSAVPATPS